MDFSLVMTMTENFCRQFFHNAQQRPKHASIPKTGRLHLPSELRNRIYHLTLLTDKPVYPLSSYPPCFRGGNKPTAALLQTCRTVHREATPIFYGQNCFYLTSGSTFQDKIGSSAKYLRRISRMAYYKGYRERFYLKLDVATQFYASPNLMEVNIDIPLPEDTPGYDAVEGAYLMAEALWPVCQVLATKRGVEDFESVLDVFHFETSESRSSKNLPRESMEGEFKDRVGEELRRRYRQKVKSDSFGKMHISSASF